MFRPKFWLFFLLLPCLATGLPADRKQKVYIVSDSCVYNYKSGTSIFNGNVQVDQGSTHLTSDKLITKSNDKNKIQEAIAYGIDKVAHYRTLPKLEDNEIHALARVIKYYPLTANISLQQDVKVTQGNDSFQGEIIHYNMNDETITVPASKNGRAVLIYDPDK